MPRCSCIFTTHSETLDRHYLEEITEEEATKVVILLWKICTPSRFCPLNGLKLCLLHIQELSGSVINV